MLCAFFFFFQAEDGIRDLVRSRGLGDVYKRQVQAADGNNHRFELFDRFGKTHGQRVTARKQPDQDCLLYTSDAADDLLCVALGGRRIIKKKTK